jgi:hypothetical protein
MADRLDCPLCNGTGDGGLVSLRREFGLIMEKYYHERKRAIAKRKAEKEVIMKVRAAHLTRDEMRLLSGLLEHC